MLNNDPLWYKDAIIYQVHVKSFFDSNNDGIGDFRGLTEKLDYIQDLGVTALWLLPFYPSPLRDDGYDIADYHNVHPNYGTRKDFRNFVREAHRRNLKVITELVINHTSDQHPWFQAARRAPPGSSKRDFYVWSDTDKKFPETRIIFTDTETSNWAWDSQAQAYYWHRFFSHQPDLNHNNPKVVKAVTRVMRFWLDMGIDGMRLDAIPYLTVREGTNNENLPETHAVLKRIRADLDQHYPDKMLLAEANQWPEDVRAYFGNGDECHMAFHFPLMPRIYMAVAQEERHPITEIMSQTPDIPSNCQWAIFLRNHDELTLEMVTDRERDYMYEAYASEARTRLNVGIRRRLAPLMDNNRSKIQLLNSLLMSLPGTPIVYYGDEIGMGDNVYLGDRNGVRTPMQWSSDRNAGFSRSDPARLYLPVIMDPVYGYESVNVEAQLRQPYSELNWMKRLIAVRKRHQAFGRGTLEFLAPGNRKILAYLREHDHETILCVANLSRSPQPVELDLQRFRGRVPVELSGQTVFPPINNRCYLLTLPGHGFYWFLLAREAEVPTWYQPPETARREFAVLVVPDGFESLLGVTAKLTESWQQEQAAKTVQLFESDVLPKFLHAQRWFAAKGEAIVRASVQAHVIWQTEEHAWMLAMVDVEFVSGERQRYFLPFAFGWEQKNDARLKALMPYTVCKVRRGAQSGVLYDAFADEQFSLAMLRAIGEDKVLKLAHGRIHFRRAAAFAQLAKDAPATAQVLGREQSNSSIVIGERLIFKAYRQLQQGTNPEVEMGRYLSEHRHYPNVAPLAGSVEYTPDEGESISLGILQGFVQNQGDGWIYTLDHLGRYLEGRMMAPSSEAAEENEALNTLYFDKMDLLGRRIGELHVALAAPTDDAAFSPERFGDDDVSALTAQLTADAAQSLEQLRAVLPDLANSARVEAQALLELEPISVRIHHMAPSDAESLKIRCHGDLHLGQVLLTEHDFLIVDFEGEPARPIAERRRKYSPLKDVAGVLRSFDYAAHAALERVCVDHPQEWERMNPVAQTWKDEASRRFLAGYGRAICALPALEGLLTQGAALLRMLTLEKALYELRYEIDNRPEKVAIPLRGILALLREAPLQ